jgi:uncharacterized repeat protein (TIGR03843 family)
LPEEERSQALTIIPGMEKAVVIEALQNGDIDLRGQFVRGSNYTFWGQLSFLDQRFGVVYKPTQGEQPLWDFARGTLAKREVAAYLLSNELGWGLVPPTVYRRKAPLGPGSVQQYIEHDPKYHFFNFSVEDKQRLRPAVLFDILSNNADRKGGHVLVDADKHIWLIDNALCFNEDDKLRTVIWDFAGEPIPDELLKDLSRLVDWLQPDGELRKKLVPFLKASEIAALASRAEWLLAQGIFPEPPPNRRSYPWPPV